MNELEVLKFISESDAAWPVTLADPHRPKADLLNTALVSLSGYMPVVHTEKEIRFAMAVSLREICNGRLSGELVGIEARRIRTLRNNAARRSKANWN